MMAPVQSTRIVPKRSAIPPENGWPMPHNRSWMAKADENTSRPQPLANEIGVRNWPAAERGPKVSRPIKQPQSTISAGVRQASSLVALISLDCGAAVLMVISFPSLANIGAWPPRPKAALRSEPASRTRMAARRPLSPARGWKEPAQSAI